MNFEPFPLGIRKRRGGEEAFFLVFLLPFPRLRQKGEEGETHLIIVKLPGN